MCIFNTSRCIRIVFPIEAIFLLYNSCETRSRSERGAVQRQHSVTHGRRCRRNIVFAKMHNCAQRGRVRWLRHFSSMPPTDAYVTRAALHAFVVVGYAPQATHECGFIFYHFPSFCFFRSPSQRAAVLNSVDTLSFLVSLPCWNVFSRNSK